MNRREAEEMMEARKEARKTARAASPTGTGTKTREALGTQATTKEKGKGKGEVRYCYDCGEQGFFGVNCPYTWTSTIDEEDDESSSLESELEGGRTRRTRELGGAR